MEKSGQGPEEFQAPRQAPPPYMAASSESAYPSQGNAQPSQAYPHPSQGYPHPQPQPHAFYTQPGASYIQPGVMIQNVHATPPGAVIVTQPGRVVVSHVLLSHNPTIMSCRSCESQMVTRVEYQPTMRTHLTCLFCCLLGLWPCAFLPYCTNSCMKADHYCQNCGAFVGTSL